MFFEWCKTNQMELRTFKSILNLNLHGNAKTYGSDPITFIKVSLESIWKYENTGGSILVVDNQNLNKKRRDGS